MEGLAELDLTFNIFMRRHVKLEKKQYNTAR